MRKSLINKFYLFFILSFSIGTIFFTLFAGIAEAEFLQSQSSILTAPILKEQRCPVCGMYPERYPQWQSQIIFENGQSVAFDSSKDMFRFFLAPSLYELHQGHEKIRAILVHDFTSGEWIDARQAFFVVGSDILGPMGKDLIPLADESAARNLIATRGGQLARFGEVEAETLAQLGPGSHGGHHHHGAFEPIGVMGGHVHGAGNWMLSYRFMRMDMDGNRKGTHDVSTAKLLENYMVAPLKMTMDMHMLGLMYAPADDLTLMAMAPYLDMKMDHRTRMGTKFTTEARGLGDIKVSALYTLFASGPHRIHLNAGLSLPTGDIERKDDTPAGPDQKLPYPMQLGSGTWDLIPGLTYNGYCGSWHWGAQALGTIRLGRNSEKYSLGDRIEVTGWLGRKLGQSTTATLRLDGRNWGDIDGADPELNPMLIPTADPDLRGGTRLDLLAGVDHVFSSGALAGNRLAIEGGIPIYQDLDGPQLEVDWLVSAGWQILW